MFKNLIFIINLFLFTSGTLFGNDKTLSSLLESYKKANIMLQKGKAQETAELLEKTMTPSFPFNYEAEPSPFKPSIKLPEICAKPIPKNLSHLEKKKYKSARGKARKEYEKQIAKEKQEYSLAFRQKFPEGFKAGFYFYALLGKSYIMSGKPKKAFEALINLDSYMPHEFNVNNTHFANAWAFTMINKSVDARKHYNCISIFNSPNATGYMAIMLQALKILQANNEEKMINFLEKIIMPSFPFDYELVPKPFKTTIKLPEICAKPIREKLNLLEKKKYKIAREKARKEYEKQVAKKKQEYIFSFRQKFPADFKAGFYFYELLGSSYMIINPPIKGLVNKAVEAYCTFRNSEAYMPHKEFTNYTAKILAAKHYFNIARACTTLSRDVDAGRYCNYALSFCPSNVPVHAELSFLLSLSAANFGAFKSAAEIYEKLYERNLFKAGVDYTRYAKMLFRLGKERKAFEILDDGLIMSSVKNEYLKDDIVFYFILERTTLATDEEIYSFYQTLGDMLEIIKLKAGMEESVAYIIKERELLTRLFYFLTNEDDLIRIKERMKAEKLEGKSTKQKKT